MFITSDGTEIDIRTNLASRQKLILVLWPCMTGNTAMYRLPVGEFNRQGVSVVQFNPRGHGGSGGQFELEACVHDLREFMESLNAKEYPLWMMGHSAGAFCVLKCACSHMSVSRYILVSPVLDSIKSYRHLYDNGNHGESSSLIAGLTTDREFMLSVLENSEWMKREVWERNRYREKIDSISRGPLIGTLMERLFLEGYEAYSEIKLHSARTSIIMPVNDNWFPMDLLSSLALQHGISMKTIPEAGDHYFTGAWKHVWRYVLDEINLN